MSLLFSKPVVVLTVLLAAVMALAPCHVQAGDPPDIKVVEVENVPLKDIVQTVRLIGTIQARRSSILIAKTPGTLDHVAYAGQKIKKGDLIAKLENEDLERTCALCSSAEKIAREQYDRMVKLEKSQLAKRQDVEDRRNQWIDAQKSLSLAKIEFDRTRFMAPFDGIVGVFKMREGVQVQAGDPIVSFYDPFELIVEFDIPTPVLEQMKANTPAGQEPAGLAVIAGKTMKVPHIQKMIDPDTHMSPAYVDFSCSGCMVGANIAVDFVVASHKNVMVIPHEAVFLRDGKPHVYGIKAEGATLKTGLCPVTLGIREKENVEIAAGLKPGDQIISRGHLRLSPDMEVKIFKAASVSNTQPSS